VNAEFKNKFGERDVFGYTARERFGSWAGESWRKYIVWSGQHQLTDLVGLDVALCGNLAEVEEAEDWNHNIHAAGLTHLYWDLPYLRSKFSDTAVFNLLAVTRNPADDPRFWKPPEGFLYLGSDLLDDGTGISALTNCGGFPDVFPNSEISPLGLIPDWNRAVEIQVALARAHPEEAHAQCALWSIWRHLGSIPPTPTTNPSNT
jgi:hypothetical protein